MQEYYSQIAELEGIHDSEIEKDIERTFTSKINHSEYIKLKRILRATAYYLPSVGYVQGFNFIVGNILRVFND